MKNLANCKPSEFLRQTNKIRKSVSKWLEITDLLNIRKTQPTIPKDTTEKEKEEANRNHLKKKANLMMESIMEEHPDETLELLALLCFVEPENVDDHEISEYLESFNELINNKAVVDFFISLVRLATVDI